MNSRNANRPPDPEPRPKLSPLVQGLVVAAVSAVLTVTVGGIVAFFVEVPLKVQQNWDGREHNTLLIQSVLREIEQIQGRLDRLNGDLRNHRHDAGK